MKENLFVFNFFKKFKSLKFRFGELLALILFICALSNAKLVIAQESPSPCPESAPIRTFDISAISVDIVYNNWGDIDSSGESDGAADSTKTPGGKIFALEKQTYTGDGGPSGENPYNSSDKIKSAVAANPDTPSYEVQPLVIRCNVGDCVHIHLTNKDINKASVMIRRAQYNVLDSEGNLVGDNKSSGSLNKGEMKMYTFFIEDKAENQGAYHIGVMSEAFIDLSYSGLWGALIAEPKGSTYLASLNPWVSSKANVLIPDFDPANSPVLTWSDWEAIIVPCQGIKKGESPSCDRLFNSPGAFENGVSEKGNVGVGTGRTANPQGSFREAVSFFHDGTFMSGGKLHQPDKNMAYPVTDPSLGNEIILPVKGDVNDSGLWEKPDGGSVHGQRFAFSTHAGILGQRGWPMMGPDGAVDPTQTNNNNTSWNDDNFKSTVDHSTRFGKSFNYRSDPFSYLKAIDEDESQSYSSYTYGEPSTACPQAYLGDPMIWRVIHGGGEEHHIFHPHGFTRWAEQPYEEFVSDPLTGSVIKDDSGQPVHGSRMYMRGIWNSEKDNLTESLTRSAALLKHRMDDRSTVTNTVDVAMLAPQEVYDVELECGAGSCHGGPGDWVEHCHVADHYTIGMWRFMRVYGTRQSNLAVLPGRPEPAKAVNSIDIVKNGTTLDGKKFCVKDENNPENTCPDVENDQFVNLEAWIKHLLPSPGVQRTGWPDPRLHPEEKNKDAEWRNPAYDPFDANRNGIVQDIDGDGACIHGDPTATLVKNEEGKIIHLELGHEVEKCDDGGDPEDWVINPPCPSLDGTFDTESKFGKMSIDGLRALTCIINGYDGDHLDWKLVNTDSGLLALNQPDGPLFQNFIEKRGDPQGRWARYRDAVMYNLKDGVSEKLDSIGPRPGARAELLFNPQDGRLEFPPLRALRGMRPPWPPNNHSGAPTLGETSTVAGIKPDATRKEAISAILKADKSELGKYPDGLCPPNAPTRSYDIVAFPALDISGKGAGGIRGVIYNRFGDTDPNAVVHSLRNDEVDVMGAKRSSEQLAIRCNVGDCVDIQFRSHITDFTPIQDNFSKLNMHTHMVHFDPTGSDGVIIGYNWEQSARPCTDIGGVVDLVSSAKDVFGKNFLALAPEMQYTKDGKPNMGGGEGPTHNVLVPDATTGIENAAGVDKIGLERAANALQWPGRAWEYAHYRWYADIQMMAFWHPHIGGFIAFPLGSADGTIVEPKGSEYRDRLTGEEKYTHSDKVIQDPLIAALGLGDGLRNNNSSLPVSGTVDGFPMLEVAGVNSDFGGNPQLGWALGMLDYEELTKTVNISASLNEDGCGGNNDRPCGNRKPQTGEDVPLFGKIDFRGGPSGLAKDDCGGVKTLNAVVQAVVLGTKPADITLEKDMFLKHTNGECNGIETDDSAMGAASSKATASLHGTLNTNRIFNRTNALYDIEPKGFNKLVDSGNTESADIITTAKNDLNAKPEPSFRENVFWWMDDIYLMFGEGTSAEPFNNRLTATNGVSAITLRNEPLDRRVSESGLEQHKVFTSAESVGDPSTPMVLAHPGDRTIFRTFVGGTQDIHAFRFLGHRFGNERWNTNTNPIDTFQNGIGYFNTYEIMGGAGANFIGSDKKQHNLPGDYLYYMSIGALDLEAGAWGLIRVGENPGLQPLDDNPGPETTTAGLCDGREIKQFHVTAVSVAENENVDEAKNIFVLANKKGKPNKKAVKNAQPLVLRVNSGDCVEVMLHPHHMDDPDRRVGLTAGMLVGDPKTSYGVNVGKNIDNGGTDQTVGSAKNEPGKTVTYRWLANKQATYDLTNPDVGIKGGVKAWGGSVPSGTQEKELGTVFLSSLVDPVQDLNDGLFGAIIVEPEGSTWKAEKRSPMGEVIADVKNADGSEFREFVIIMHEVSRKFASSLRPQKTFNGSFNYRRSGDGPPFVDVDPGLVFKVAAGNPTKVRLIYANGSEDRTFTINGHRWHKESNTEGSASLSVIQMGPSMRYDIELEGNDVDGDGKADPGASKFPGDYFFGVAEHRSAMGGQWGVIRVE